MVMTDDCVCKDLLHPGESCFCLHDAVTSFTSRDALLLKDHVYLFEHKEIFAQDLERSLLTNGGFALVLDKSKGNSFTDSLRGLSFSPDVLLMFLEEDTILGIYPWSKPVSAPSSVYELLPLRIKKFLQDNGYSPYQRLLLRKPGKQITFLFARI